MLRYFHQQITIASAAGPREASLSMDRPNDYPRLSDREPSLVEGHERS
jgi:hypothetical protein